MLFKITQLTTFFQFVLAPGYGGQGRPEQRWWTDQNQNGPVKCPDKFEGKPSKDLNKNPFGGERVLYQHVYIDFLLQMIDIIQIFFIYSSTYELGPRCVFRRAEAATINRVWHELWPSLFWLSIAGQTTFHGDMSVHQKLNGTLPTDP